MSIASDAIGVLKIVALFDPALAPVVAVASGIDTVVESSSPLLTEVQTLLAAHGGDQQKAALHLQAFNKLPQGQVNAIMDRAGSSGGSV